MIERLLTLWLPSLFAVTGIAALIAGLHGRRIDDHPLCRRCGFDLFGKPPDSTICPECGIALSEPRRIRIGHRRRIRSLLIVAAVLAIPAALVLGIAATLTIRGIDPNPYKPISWLVLETRSDNAKRRADAFTEICFRLRTDRLPRKTIDSLVAKALDLQAQVGSDPAQVPVGLQEWCAFIELAHLAEKVSDAHWTRYATQSAVFVLDVRPRVTKGDLLPVHLRRLDRTGNISFEPIVFLSMRIDGRSVESINPIDQWSDRYYYDSELTWHAWPNEPALKALEPGAHTVTVSVRAMFPGEGATKEPLSNPPSRTFELSRGFTLLPPDERSVTLVHDQSLSRAVCDAIIAQQLAYHSCGTGDGRVYLQLTLKLAPPDKLPTGIAFRAYARSRGHEWPMKESMCWGGVNWKTIAASTDPLVVTGDATFDIVLRPDVEAATRTLDVQTMLDDEILLKGLPVTYAPSID